LQLIINGGAGVMDILQRDGLTIEMLGKLSYKSELGINLKKNLHYFDKKKLIEELIKINEWYDSFDELHELALDYRIKSIQSAIMKYKRYYPDHQARKVFDDLLGFRSLCDNYEDVLALKRFPELRVADMSKGKANEDGYRGVHVYFQLDGIHYPIEIQYNTYYDRQFNNWLHKYVYKKKYDNSVGCHLRELYEGAKILSEQDFKEALEHVLFGS
jgi:putative GTP pyrophosphokinase